MLKIGLIIGRLPKEFIENNDDKLQWELVREIGDRIEHDYLNLLPAEVWPIIVNDIPALRRFCEQTLAEAENI